MNEWYKKFRTHTLVKVSFFNAFSVFLRVIFSYISNKVIVVYLGPVGTALTEQLRNFVQALQGFSTMGINEGVIRYSSLYESRKDRLRNFLRMAYKLVFAASFLLMFILILFAPQVNAYLFPGNDFTTVIYMAAILLPLYAYQTILLAVLNGFQRYKKVVYITTGIHFFGVLFTFIMTVRLHMLGALLSIVFTPVIGLFLLILLIPDERSSILLLPFGKTDLKYLKRLLPFIFMALTSALSIPLFTIFIRHIIIEELGKEQAGYWDAIRKISAFYFMFISPVFAMYYFPRLSKLNNNIAAWRKEIKNMIFHFYPFIFLGMLILYIYRSFFTLFVFSADYLAMNALYFWQLLGDALRLFSLLLAYRMWTRSMVNRFIFAEISYWLLYYFLSATTVQKTGLNGVMHAYVVANLYYLVLMLLYFGKELFSGRISGKGITDNDNESQANWQ